MTIYYVYVAYWRALYIFYLIHCITLQFSHEQDLNNIASGTANNSNSSEVRNFVHRINLINTYNS